MRPGEDKEHVFILKEETTREGDMWGVTMADVNKWVDANGDLTIKFIIFYLHF